MEIFCRSRVSRNEKLCNLLSCKLHDPSSFLPAIYLDEKSYCTIDCYRIANNDIKFLNRGQWYSN